MNAVVTEALRQEQRDYYRLCEEAERLGVPTSLDDPLAALTVAELEQQKSAKTRA